MMQFQSFGAAEEVTGSCHLLTVGNRRVLLDCGMFQGSRRTETRNRSEFGFDPTQLDAVVLSHAHVDHSGRLPLLMQRGFRGPVYAHPATLDLCRILLKDSAFLNERDCELANRRRERRGLKPLEPLYRASDVTATMKQFRPLAYDQELEIVPGVRVRLTDAGHILGSSIIELWLHSGHTKRKLVYTGDLGHRDAPILRDPTPITAADLVVMESTYGDRLHRSWDATREEFLAVLEHAQSNRGNVLIPAFAVGRSQLVLYWLAAHYNEAGIGRWRVFLDSPLAIQATQIYVKHTELYDHDAMQMWTQNQAHSLLPNLHATRTTNQSKGLNRIRSGAIIIAGSGMCTGGRITHHLLNNVWRRECHVVIVGFQAAGTTGRALVDGAQRIRLFGESVRVAAHVHTIGGLSAHADQEGLIRWLRGFRQSPTVLLVHGEAKAQATLSERLRKDRFSVQIQKRRQRIDLAHDPNPRR